MAVGNRTEEISDGGGLMSTEHQIAQSVKVPQAFGHLLVLVNVDASPIFHPSEILFGKFAVLGKLRDTEIIRTIFRAICESMLDKTRDKVRHLGNVVGGVDQFGLFDIQSTRVFKKRVLI